MTKRKPYTVLLEQRLLTVVEIEAGSRYEAYTAARELIADPQYTLLSGRQRMFTLDSNQWIEHRHTVRLVDGP